MNVRCPACGSEVCYRYGRTRSGSQRYLCLGCGRQYSAGDKSLDVSGFRPVCGRCGRIMYVYKREKNAIRFRCAGYPACRQYAKVILEGGPDGLLPARGFGKDQDQDPQGEKECRGRHAR